MSGLGRSRGGGHGNPLQYSLPGGSHGRRSLAGYGPWGRKESDTTEVTECAHMNNQGLAGWQKPSRRNALGFLGRFKCKLIVPKYLNFVIIYFFFPLSLSLSLLTPNLNFFSHRLLFLHLSTLYSSFSIISTFSFHFLPGYRIAFLHRFGTY